MSDSDLISLFQEMAEVRYPTWSGDGGGECRREDAGTLSFAAPSEDPRSVQLVGTPFSTVTRCALYGFTKGPTVSSEVQEGFATRAPTQCSPVSPLHTTCQALFTRGRTDHSQRLIGITNVGEAYLPARLDRAAG